MHESFSYPKNYTAYAEIVHCKNFQPAVIEGRVQGLTRGMEKPQEGFPPLSSHMQSLPLTGKMHAASP